MSKLVIESTNKHDTPADIEDKLEKALSTIQLQREKRQFSDVFLKDEMEKADRVVNAVFENMLNEIAEVLEP